MQAKDLVKDAILVVAHPDDEVLWFSSILLHVKKVVVCFSHENLTLKGKEEFFKTYPLKHVEFLSLEGFGGYHKINFRFHVRTSCGILIKNSLRAALRYKKNCRILRQKLEALIPDKGVVFTHNPWGEYGHEEHVQVSTIIRYLCERKNASLWYNNYGGRKTYSLMKKTLFSHDYDSFQVQTDKELAHQLKSFYLEKGCWTWDEYWKWFDTETFYSVKPNMPLTKYGHVLPVNLINVTY